MHKLTAILNSNEKNIEVILNKWGDKSSNVSWSLNMHEKALQVLLQEIESIKTSKTDLVFIKNNKIIKSYGSTKTYLSRKLKDSFVYQTAILAAEFHDLGKAHNFFQNRLRSKKAYYPVRHEYISILILEYIIKNINDKVNTKKVNEYIINRLKNNTFIDIFEENVVYDLLYILGTHHTLPAVSDVIDNSNYLFEEPAAKLKNLKVLLSEKELTVIQEKLKNYITKFQSQKLTFKEIYFIRNSLMLGDHIASGVICKKEYNTLKEDTLYAKSIKEEKSYHHVQTFKEHNALVKKYTKKVLPLFFYDNKVFSEYNTLNMENYINEVSEGKYSWQNDGLEFLKRNNDDKPKFVILGASTGYGKTRFGSKMQHIIGSKKRLTVLHPLKSLTLQTGLSYKRDTPFLEEDISVLIGSKVDIDIFESKISDEEDDYNQEDLYVNNLAHFNYNIDKSIFANYLNSSSYEFLNTPILISTIDYIIRACDHRKSGHLKANLRIASSDLLIDEIDNFSVDDMKSIVQLMFLAGLYKTNVYLSSATIPLTYLEKLYEAYNLGIGEDTEYSTLYIAEDNFQKKGNESISDFYTNVVQGRNYNPINKGKIVDINMSNIKDNILELHGNWCEVDNGVSYSIGIYRIAHINNIKYMYDQLNKIDFGEDFEVELIPYHSRFTVLRRSFLEHTLGDLLNRKNYPLKNKTLFKKMKKKNRIIIIIASPVEEVGQDHDADWEIQEPSTSQQIIQMGGRCRRHRDTDFDLSKHNIIIMNKNFALQKQESGNSKVQEVYSKPGFEKESNIFENNGSRDLISLFNEKEDLLFNPIKMIIPSKEENFLSYKEQEIIKESLELVLSKIINRNDKIQYFIFNNMNNDIGFYNEFRKSDDKDEVTVFLEEYTDGSYEFKGSKNSSKIEKFLNYNGEHQYNKISEINNAYLHYINKYILDYSCEKYEEISFRYKENYRAIYDDKFGLYLEKRTTK